jgi:hypothetical protein
MSALEFEERSVVRSGYLHLTSSGSWIHTRRFLREPNLFVSLPWLLWNYIPIHHQYSNVFLIGKPNVCMHITA